MLSLQVQILASALLVTQQVISILQQQHAKFVHQDALLAPQVLFALHALKDTIYPIAIVKIV